MTRYDALKLIPPGWVECDIHTYSENAGKRWKMEPDLGEFFVYAIPAPKPEPRRVPCRDLVLEFHHLGYSAMVGFHEAFETVRISSGGWDAVTNTKWRLDFDTREWVEVLDES